MFRVSSPKFDVIAYPPLPREAREVLKGYSVAHFRYGEEKNLLKALEAGTKALIIVGLNIDKDLLSKSRGLRVIIARTDGLDYVDLSSVEEAGICIANQPEAIAESVAEHTLGAVISVMKYINAGHEYVVSGEWFRKGWPSQFRGGLMLGRSLGLLGFGRIGHLLASKFKNLGVSQIYYWSRSRVDRTELVLEAVRLPLKEVFMKSDIVINTLPDTQETHHIITAELLESMPKGGLFVNVGRGGVLKTEDLIKALEIRNDLRVVLDVYEQEPLNPNNPLILKYSRTGKVLLTPHIAGYSEESMRVTALLAALQVKKFFEEGCLWDPAIRGCKQCIDSPPPLKELISKVLRCKE